MNSALVTTGPPRLFVGSSILFQVQPFLDGLVWDLTGGGARLLMTDPNGMAYNLIASIVGGGARVAWTVLDVPGTWVRAWKLTDATGIIEYTEPIVFDVVESPGTPF